MITYRLRFPGAPGQLPPYLPVLVMTIVVAGLWGDFPSGELPSARGQWRAASHGTPTTPAAVNRRDSAPDTAPVGGSETIRRTSGATSFVSDPGPTALPQDAGQVWRVYDLQGYTRTLPAESHPQQAIVDWVLRETGTDIWFGQPLGILSASDDTLRVYHTPAVQKKVEDIVRRFVASEASRQVFGIRLVTLVNPDWRAAAHASLTPLTVQTPGIQAWMLTREQAAVLLDGLRKRTDYREHNTPNMVVRTGQTHRLERTRPLAYIRDIAVPSIPGAPSIPGVSAPRLLAAAEPPGTQPSGPIPRLPTPGTGLEMGQVEEGFHLELSPLLSADGRYVDAVVKLETSHVEKLAPVWIESPIASRAQQRTQLQVPQTASWRMHERFRWPADQVLLVSCGMVANPSAERKSAAGFAGPLLAGPTRTEALLLLETKGNSPDPLAETQQAQRGEGVNYRGRY